MISAARFPFIDFGCCCTRPDQDWEVVRRHSMQLLALVIAAAMGCLIRVTRAPSAQHTHAIDVGKMVLQLAQFRAFLGARTILISVRCRTI
jgi:hypothetical protein